MRKYKNAVCKHIHEEATDLFNDGDITAERMREYDASCLVSPVRAASPQARAVRRPAMAAASPRTEPGR